MKRIAYRITLALGATMIAASAAQAAAPFAVQDGPRIVIPTDRDACKAQLARLPWCGAQRVQGQATPSVKEVSDLQARILKNYHYSFRADAPWRSFYDVAFDNRSWKAHCGGMTFTMLEALTAAGLPTTKMWRAIVIPATRDPRAKAPPVLHMVGIVELEGTLYVVGDTNDLSVYPLSQADFVPTMISPVAEGMAWRRTQPLAPTQMAER